MSGLQQELLRHFHWLHSHPELSLEEHATTAYLRDALRGLGVEPVDTGLDTGLLARVGDGAGPVVALRCDIDALPIEEATALPYASRNPGRMHACGHDFHTAAMLGAAALLQDRAAELPGGVLLLFQPAEEAAGGAKHVLDTGALEGVRQIYGLHVDPALPAGVIALKPGAEHAAVDRFDIRIEGTGCHAAHPNQGADPIVAAGQLIGAAQGIVSRNTDPFDNAVVSITRIEAGSTWNVVPQTASLEGTARTLLPETRELIRRRLGEICRGVALAAGVEVRFDWHEGVPATDNDPGLTDFVRGVALKRGLTVRDALPSMGGEDFSLYQQHIPGVFFSIGVASGHPLHSPRFVADPSPLADAAGLLAAIGASALEREAKL